MGERTSSRTTLPTVTRSIIGSTFQPRTTLPTVALTFLNGLLMFGLAFAQWPGWIPGLIIPLVTVAVHGTFIIVARRQLFTRFREIVARASGVSMAAKPPALPPLVQLNIPPVRTP